MSKIVKYNYGFMATQQLNIVNYQKSKLLWHRVHAKCTHTDYVVSIKNDLLGMIARQNLGTEGESREGGTYVDLIMW